MRWHELQEISVSRLEERHPQHSLGVLGQRDPGEISDRGWNQRDDPDPWTEIGAR